MSGGANDDILKGGDGRDILDGGTGSDTLDGGFGSDTYLFGKGDGQDILLAGTSNDNAFNKFNVLQFKAGVVPSDITVSRTVVGNDLVLKMATTADSFTVRDFFKTDDPANAFNQLQQVKFSDGTVWDLSTISAKAFKGAIGDDTLSGGIGDDVLEGGNGFDVLSGNAGNDSLSGGANDDILKGGDGRDILDGGTGNDTLDGGLGSDTYLFGKGDGQDILLAGTSNDNAFSKFNVLQFKAGVVPSELDLLRFGDDLQVAISGTADAFTVKSFYFGNNPSNAYNQLQQIQFADGAFWDLTAITAKTMPNHTPTLAIAIPDQTVTKDDPLNFQVPANSFTDIDTGDALAFTATLANGAALPSWLSFNATTLAFSGVPNSATVGSLNIKVTATDKGSASAADTFALTVTQGNHAPHGNNKVFNALLEDTPRVFTVLDFGFSDSDSGDQLQQVQITSLSGTGSLTLHGVKISAGQIIDVADINAGLLIFTPTIGINGNSSAGFSFKVSDGDLFSVDANRIDMNILTVMCGTQGKDLLVGGNGRDAIKGLGGNDTLKGLGGVDFLDGGDGDDLLDGGAGGDLLDGGAGADKMIGGAGDDIYLVDNVKDIVIESKNGGSDGIASSVNIVLPDNVETLKLADGAAKNGTGNALNNTVSGNTTANKLDGGPGNDRIFGGDGDDTLIGGPGDDALYGGMGNDTLDGGLGNDIYWFSHGVYDGGQDVIRKFGDKAGDQDLINLSSYLVGFQNLHFATSGKNTIITMDKNGSSFTDFQITLLGVKADTLGADDFIF